MFEQMVWVRRLNDSRVNTELVYYVTIDSQLAPPSALVELSSYLRPQQVALILGEEVDESHIVEPYRNPLQPSAGWFVSSVIGCRLTKCFCSVSLKWWYHSCL